MLRKISTLDATFVVLMAACGLALKPIIGPLAKLIGSVLFMPGGVIAGSVYMMWPMLALLVVRRFGIAMLVGFIQGTVVLVTGWYGSHGILSLPTYLTPCLFIDLSYWVLKRYKNRIVLFIPTALGNLTGSLMVGVFVYHLPTLPLFTSLIPAFIFGGLGGWFASALYLLLIRSFPQFSKE